MTPRFCGVLLGVCAYLSAGCGLSDAPGDPLVIAHRVAAGLWPENSRTALNGALARNFAGIEVDLVLTKDEIPILSHDPWMTREYCTRADGTELPDGERLYIRDFTLAELHERFRCGGVPHTDHPDAVVVADTHVTLDEMIALLRGAPRMWVQLDVKYEPGFTADPETYAKEILERWKDAELPNPVFASANLPELLRGFRAEWPALETTLIWPRFTADTSNTATALTNELTTRIGVQDLAARIIDAQANGVAIAWQLADRQVVEALREEGFKVQLWTVNGESRMAAFCRWPVDALITDYPEEVPCQR